MGSWGGRLFGRSDVSAVHHSDDAVGCDCEAAKAHRWYERPVAPNSRGRCPRAMRPIKINRSSGGRIHASSCCSACILCECGRRFALDQRRFVVDPVVGLPGHGQRAVGLGHPSWKKTHTSACADEPAAIVPINQPGKDNLCLHSVGTAHPKTIGRSAMQDGPCLQAEGS